MEKKNGFNLNQLCIFGLAIIWSVGAVLLKDSIIAGEHYWIAFAFGLVGLAISEISLVLRTKANRSTVEVGAVSVVYTIIFAIAELCVNASYAVEKGITRYPFFIIGNLVLIFVYIIWFYNANRNLSRVNQLTARSAEKMRNVAAISREISLTLGVCNDAELRSELLKTKEKIDLSNNVSQSFSLEVEEQLIQKFSEIRQDILNGVPKEETIRKIKDADACWNMRNSIVNTTK